MELIAYDLYCGLGGWSEGFLSEGYECIGFDVEAHDYGTGGYPGKLIIRDVRSIHGSELKDATCIVGSSPCQEFSYRGMPWKRAKALPPPYLGMELFNAQFRIQREASEAAGRHIPMVVENVCKAQKWVGRAQWHYGSYYLWGDVPALMPMTLKATKVPGFRFDGESHGSFQSASVAQSEGNQAIKNGGGSWFNVAHNTTSGKGQNPDGRKINGPSKDRQLAKGEFGGHKTIMADGTSKSAKRKAASAMIAKIPFPLSQHIARCFLPNG